ncbi:MAG: hypothetical protein WA687_12590, partial [Solirubrobacterales bacterium]
SGDARSVLSVAGAAEVAVQEVEGGEDDSVSTAISPLYSLTSPTPLEEPITLRFDLPAGAVDPSLLRVAFRDSAAEEWSWIRGRVEGWSYVVETGHLSEWQLREMHCSDSLGGPERIEVEVENPDPDDPLLQVCPREIGGKPGLIVLNNRSIGLEFPVLEGIRVVEVGGGTIAEDAWGPLNSLQFGKPWLLVPGDGFVALAFDVVPGELTFESTNSALVFDLLLTVAGGAGARFVECAHTFSESFRDSQLGIRAKLSKILKDGIIACGGPVGSIAGIPDLLRKVWDSFGAITDSATVSFTRPVPARLPEPRPALRLSGPVDFTGVAPVRIGMTKADAEAVTGLHFLGTAILPGCGEMRPSPGMGDATEDDYLPGVSLMIVGPSRGDLLGHGRIARVDVFKRGYTTEGGLGIGSTEAEVKEEYGVYVKVSESEYGRGHYLTVRPPDAARSRYRIVFETDGSRVTAIRAGQLPEVGFVEHCL